ncbi:glycosyltransferase family 2 protein [Alkaliphilus serpentinus]|uniref:Glycosyltransferase family 2 protein n=2 Tax=Alkaliphilus serpentinus TaxID=1482731 RepID=A0A833HMA8_9FIRM|nr:glycosyltransferase family 2 protein [Alkaliphilus serpentinus]KAB3527385.1 glycosyltransferase family 2 protein [Alkaliphilus serpentinus]
MDQKISVIIPAYNEEDTIEATIKSLLGMELLDEIIVVDDGSLDHTREVVSKFEEVTLISLDKNSGKGRALKEGIHYALNKFDIITLLDADLKESSKEVEKLINPLVSKEADVTIAKFPAAKRKGGFGMVKRLAYLGVLLHTGRILSTTLSGQRAFKKKVLENIEIGDYGFGIEYGMTLDILKKGYLIEEVEVEMYHRETGRDFNGFLHRGKQFIEILKVIFRKKLQGLKN